MPFKYSKAQAKKGRQFAEKLPQELSDDPAVQQALAEFFQCVAMKEDLDLLNLSNTPKEFATVQADYLTADLNTKEVVWTAAPAIPEVAIKHWSGRCTDRDNLVNEGFSPTYWGGADPQVWTVESDLQEWTASSNGTYQTGITDPTDIVGLPAGTYFVSLSTLFGDDIVPSEGTAACYIYVGEEKRCEAQEQFSSYQVETWLLEDDAHASPHLSCTLVLPDGGDVRPAFGYDHVSGDASTAIVFAWLTIIQLSEETPDEVGNGDNFPEEAEE